MDSPNRGLRCHVQREGEQVTSGQKQRPRGREGCPGLGERRLLIGSGGGETAKSGNETRRISSLVKVTSKRQDTLPSEEAPILELLLSLVPKLSSHRHLGCAPTAHAGPL